MALVHPVVVVSLGVDMLAVLWVLAVSPVLAMRWFSFVHEGLSPAMEPNGLRHSEHAGSWMSRRNRVAKVEALKVRSPGFGNVELPRHRRITDDSAPHHVSGTASG